MALIPARTSASIVGSFLGLSIVLSPAVFGGAPAINPDEGRPHVGWKDAGLVVGRVAFVSGTVASVRKAGRLTFLDFDDASREGFVGVIFQDALGKFPESPETLYKGKNVQLRGIVTTYQGQPQIQLSDPSQVKVLSELPAAQYQPPRAVTTGAELTIGTYNVLNLFDEIDDPYYLDENTLTKPREQLERLAKTVHSVNADVLALEEVENRSYLERFVEVFLADMGYQHVVLFEGNDSRGIDVAVLSRVPVGVTRSNRHRTFPGPDGKPMVFERDLLQVELLPDGAPPFEMWVVHLKSNYEGREYAEPIRKAEAAEVRRQLDARLAKDAKARIVLCGDFNDTPDSATLATIIGSGPTAMRSFYGDLSADNRVTYNQPPHLTMIDFLLATPAMAESFVPGSYRVLPGTIESSGSDHNPVFAKVKAR